MHGACCITITDINISKQVQWPQSDLFTRKLLLFQKLTDYRLFDNLWIQNVYDVTPSHSMRGSAKQSRKNLTWTKMFHDHSECQKVLTQWHTIKYKQTWNVNNSAVRISNFAFCIKPTEQDGSGSNTSPCFQAVTFLHCSQAVTRLTFSQAVTHFPCIQTVKHLTCIEVVTHLTCSQAVTYLHTSQAVTHCHFSQ